MRSAQKRKDKPDLETTDCPWWVAGAEYVFRIALAWRTYSPSTPDRTEAALSEQVELTANWVFWNRVFVHDGIHSKNPQPEDMFGDRNAKRFFGFAFLFALRRFAEEDLDEWRGRAAVLAEAITDLKSGSANQSMPQPPLVWAEAIPVRTGPLTSTGTPAVDNAIKMFESLPEFPRSQVWMRDRQAKLAAPAATDESGRPMIEARKRFALAHYNIRAAAFYQLVSTIELQNAFMTLLDYLEDMAWQDFIGERPLEVRNGAPSIAPGIVRRKRWWIRQGYKRLEALRRAQQVLKTGKRRGRRPDQKRRDAICNAISKHGDAWRDHLSEILKELDSKNDILLGDFQGREIDLGDGDRIKVAKWEDLDLAQGEQRRQIVDMLRKYAD